MEQGNILNGLIQKKNNILFHIAASKEWFGGVNYLKNLFKALKISKTSINPVVSIIGDDSCLLFLNLIAKY